MIYEVQRKWDLLGDKSIDILAQECSISVATVRKYIHMTEADIAKLDTPTNYKKRKTVMDEYMNIIFKILKDKKKPSIIMSYIIKKGYTGNWNTLENYITLFAKNNFNLRLGKSWPYTFEYPEDVTIIKRNELLKYLTTKNLKAKKNGAIASNFELIKEKFPVVALLKEIYDDFYESIMGKNPDRIDTFIQKYTDSVIKGFVEGILKDIFPVKNAISHDESSGFVEGNNNKFKLIKRILYGRANLDTLFKKSYVAFKVNSIDFELSQLLKKMPL